MAIVTRESVQEPQHYLENNVRFSFSQCDFRQFCITKLHRDEVRRLYATLGYLEKFTWKSLRDLPREKGITVDKRDGSAYMLLQPRLATCSTFGHFRVDGTRANMRVFIGINQDLAFILLIDREGRVQHT